MKILWICPFFLHPTDRGGQIRTLGTLKELHRRNEVHFAALNDPANLEGPKRSHEYCSKHIEVPHIAPSRSSLAILPQIVAALWSNQPLAVSRYASGRLRGIVGEMIAKENYDAIVCDFLAAAPNVPDLSQSILFQHNVETIIWRRHAEQATSPLKRMFFKQQVRKMALYEQKVCQESKSVIAVSEIDAERMRDMFGLNKVDAVSTGVDVEALRRPPHSAQTNDLIFSGSMDWLPNVDAIEFFLSEVFPLICQQRPETTLKIAGRSPDPRVIKAAKGVPGVIVTGSVRDMRPLLWDSKVSIVPIRIGGGTRLKVYECMAASLPVVSTTVGAEGLAYSAGENILIEDAPQAFADACVSLLADENRRSAITVAGLELVRSKYSWASVALDFEALLEQNGIASAKDDAFSKRLA